MGIILSYEDKLAILAIASVLIILTLIITTCLVKPTCFLHRFFVKPKEKKKEAYIDLGYLPSLVNPESQHFHLSVVPVYGQEKISDQIANPPPSLSYKIASSLSKYENLTHFAEKARNRYSSIKRDQINDLETFPKIDISFDYEEMSESAIRLHIKVHKILKLKMKPYLVEPSCYVTIVLVGNKIRRKSIINKATEREIYRTETVKRSLEPIFSNADFISEELPRSLLKEGTIKLRVIDHDRYANDTCIGEVAIPLKQIQSIECSDEKRPNLSQNSNEQENKNKVEDNEQKESNDSAVNANNSSSKLFILFPVKETKGELCAEFSYYPTSNRIAVKILKGRVRPSVLSSIGSSSTLHPAFFARIIMFKNGRLLQKHETSLSIRLVWSKKEILTFVSPEDSFKGVIFMCILSFKLQNSTLPNPPGSPGTPETAEDGKDVNNNEEPQSLRNSSNSSRKENFIGHFIFDADSGLEEIFQDPRNGEKRWHKLH